MQRLKADLHRVSLEREQGVARESELVDSESRTQRLSLERRLYHDINISYSIRIYIYMIMSYYIRYISTCINIYVYIIGACICGIAI